MKAMLVIDAPDSCLNCKLGQFNYVCGATLEETLGYIDARPSWCPLKQMPSKRETMVHWETIGGKVTTHEPSEYDKGWNECVDYLEGEDNE